MASAKSLDVENKAAPQAPYFTPRHPTSPGVPIALSSSTPTLFTPLQIRDVVLRNRILVAPMCQYSTAHSGPNIGALTDYHVATLGHYALKGASLVFIEATGVQFNGRITPNCPGLWADAQIPGLKRVADFIKSQGSLCGIQLAHAGRKASTTAPWVSAKHRQLSTRAPIEVGGWPDNVVGPSGGDEQSWDGKGPSPDGGFYSPRELSTQEVKEVIRDFAKAAERAVKAGVDVIEIHGAHGYLISSFLSPITNRRMDQYGGSFENRIRIVLETVQETRKVIPPGMPLFLRISSTEWMEETDIGKRLGSWDVESTIRLAKLLPDLGVDLLDVSSGGNHPLQRINMFNSKDYQTKIAAQIRREVQATGKKLLIGAVGLITDADQAKDIVDANMSLIDGQPAALTSSKQAGLRDPVEGEADIALDMTNDKQGKQPMADVILVARQFMREPEWVLRVAAKLGVDVAWPVQFLKVRFPKL